MLRLKQTCGGCPEQYDVFHEETYIGFMHLRYGYFYAEYGGKTVYEAHPRGDGVFEEDERVFHLNAACRAIEQAMTESSPKPIYESEA